MHATDDIVTVIIIIMHSITIYDWMHVAGECTDNVQYMYICMKYNICLNLVVGQQQLLLIAINCIRGIISPKSPKSCGGFPVHYRTALVCCFGRLCLFKTFLH